MAAFLAAAAAGDLTTVERHLSAGDVEAHAHLQGAETGKGKMRLRTARDARMASEV